MGISTETRVMEKLEKEKKGRDQKQAARDSPIYLQVKANYESCLWYVVEDDHDANDIDNDKVIFRQLDFPEFDNERFPNSLVVLNSRLYLIGGRQRTSKGGHLKPSAGYDYLDLEQKWRWGQEGSFAAYCSTDSVACSKDGLIYILEPHHCYRMDPRGGGVRSELPVFPSKFGITPKLLGISEKFIYAYSWGCGDEKGSNLLVRYDLEKNEWSCLYSRLFCNWSPGVVLYGDSYLLCFGTGNPTVRRSDELGVYVFDIIRREWLDGPVKGLDGALPVLPDVEDKHLYLECFLPHLFQVGTNRFALVWNETFDEPVDACDLHCHKFTFDDHTLYTSSSSHTTNQPSFVARVLADGVLTIEKPASRLLGCTVAVESCVRAKGTDDQSAELNEI